MSNRTTGRAAWALCGLTLILITAAAALSLLYRPNLGEVSGSFVWFSSAVVGGLVASRRPANLVGWIFLGGALGSAVSAFTGAYAVYGIAGDPGSLPLAQAMAWLSVSSRLVGPALLFILLPLYFPNGRLVSRRWRPVVGLVLGMLTLASVWSALVPGEAVYDSGIPNPLGVEAFLPVRDAVNSVLFALYMGLIFVAAASLVVRFLRSAGAERQQLKWLTFAAAFIPVWFLVNAPIERSFTLLFPLMDALVISGLPVAAGVAILRYRLYDIDVLINRTLVYATLTVTLALVYFGGVVGSQYVLRGLIGQESQLAIVASTLAIAALFNPLRRRIQAFIDRRFYRRKYDAAKTLEAFSVKLRDETDLESLNEDLISVVRETVQPQHVSLWLKPNSTERKSKTEANGKGGES